MGITLSTYWKDLVVWTYATGAKDLLHKASISPLRPRVLGRMEDDDIVDCFMVPGMSSAPVIFANNQNHTTICGAGVHGKELYGRNNETEYITDYGKPDRQSVAPRPAALW